jgi:hypothetical protein
MYKVKDANFLTGATISDNWNLVAALEQPLLLAVGSDGNPSPIDIGAMGTLVFQKYIFHAIMQSKVLITYKVDKRLDAVLFTKVGEVALWATTKGHLVVKQVDWKHTNFKNKYKWYLRKIFEITFKQREIHFILCIFLSSIVASFSLLNFKGLTW